MMPHVVMLSGKKGTLSRPDMSPCQGLSVPFLSQGHITNKRKLGWNSFSSVFPSHPKRRSNLTAKRISPLSQGGDHQSLEGPQIKSRTNIDIMQEGCGLYLSNKLGAPNWKRFLSFFPKITLTGSCYTTIAITIERFLSIRHPFFIQRNNIKARMFIVPVLVNIFICGAAGRSKSYLGPSSSSCCCPVSLF